MKKYNLLFLLFIGMFTFSCGGEADETTEGTEENTEELAENLKPKSVLIEPGAVFFNQSNPPSNFYRLAYSSIPTRRIAEGIGEVARSISKSGLR